MPKFSEKGITPSHYFKSLTPEDLEKIDEEEYQFIDLPEKDKENFSPFDILPTKIMVEISSYLKSKPHHIIPFLKTHKRTYNMFQQDVCTDLLSSLLWYVAAGEQKTVQKILHLHPELLPERGAVTDYSGRTFKNISAFEYALWALDVRYMCNMMLDCLPPNEEGEKLRITLLAQFEQLETKGITYNFMGLTQRERHYDISYYTNALNRYAQMFRWGKCYDYFDYKKEWNSSVAAAQFCTVAHVAQHVCEVGIAFDPVPSFREKTFNRTLRFFNWDSKSWETWWPNYGTEEGRFGIAKHGSVKGPSTGFRDGSIFKKDEVTVDIIALIALWKVRTCEDLPQLKLRLQNPIKEPDTTPCCVL